MRMCLAAATTTAALIASPLTAAVYDPPLGEFGESSYFDIGFGVEYNLDIGNDRNPVIPIQFIDPSDDTIFVNLTSPGFQTDGVTVTLSYTGEPFGFGAFTSVSGGGDGASQSYNGQFFDGENPFVATLDYEGVVERATFNFGKDTTEIPVDALTLSFEFDEPTSDPSVVPLPAAGWMLIAGVGGIAALRRKR